MIFNKVEEIMLIQVKGNGKICSQGLLKKLSQFLKMMW